MTRDDLDAILDEAFVAVVPDFKEREAWTMANVSDHPKMSPWEIERAINLRDRHWSFARIGRQLGYAGETVRQVLERHY
jgi:hypothetical protein